KRSFHHTHTKPCHFDRSSSRFLRTAQRRNPLLYPYPSPAKHSSFLLTGNRCPHSSHKSEYSKNPSILPRLHSSQGVRCPTAPNISLNAHQFRPQKLISERNF